MNHFEPSQKMLHDYIQNKLSAAQTERLEIWLADHPQVVQDLELDLMFKQGLAEIQIIDNNEHNLFTPSANYSFYNRLASAFLLIIVFLLGGLTAQYFDINPGNSLVSPETILLSTTRGAEVHASLSSNKNTVIQIPVGYLSEDSFSVELINNSQLAYQIRDLIPKDDLVTVLIPKGLLDSDLYQLELKNLNTDERETYNLEVK